LALQKARSFDEEHGCWGECEVNHVVKNSFVFFCGNEDGDFFYIGVEFSSGVFSGSFLRGSDVMYKFVKAMYDRGWKRTDEAY
jgi:hypothetical protein